MNKVYWLRNTTPGRLGTMARPRGGLWLQDDIRSLRALGVDVVVSLLELEEESELQLMHEGRYCFENGIEYRSFPIRDYGVPESEVSASKVVWSIANDLWEGKSIVIHCRVGIGRSTLIAASVLAATGLPLQEAVDRIELTRGVRVPDTEEQVSWLRSFTSKYIGKPP